MQEPGLASDPIRSRFRELKNRKEAALIAYLTGGDPDLESFKANAAALIEGGADILEVGIPFSDPIADGPVIQASSSRALASGATPVRVLDAVKELSSRFEHFPVVILTYFNPVSAMGIERFLVRCRASGVGGLIIPDLPVEEAYRLHDLAAKYGLDIIHQVAPNTPADRIQQIIEKTSGFLYMVSLYGVTGPRRTLGPQALEMVSKVKALSEGRVPVAVGFGVSTPDQVAQLMRSGADGAIVGSALVDIVSRNTGNPKSTLGQLRKMASDLKHATRSQPLQ